MPVEQLPLPIPHWRDLLEILIVAYVIYRLLRFLMGTRALQILHRGRGCILPLTQNPVSDVLVVSEETATISLARIGNLERGRTTETVGVLLIGVVE